MYGQLLSLCTLDTMYYYCMSFNWFIDMPFHISMYIVGVIMCIYNIG